MSGIIYCSQQTQKSTENTNKKWQLTLKTQKNPLLIPKHPKSETKTAPLIQKIKQRHNPIKIEESQSKIKQTSLHEIKELRPELPTASQNKIEEHILELTSVEVKSDNKNLDDSGEFENLFEEPLNNESEEDFTEVIKFEDLENKLDDSDEFEIA